MNQTIRKQTEAYLSQQEVSNILNVKIETLNHWRCIKRYKIPYIKLGRVILYPQTAFIDWLNTYGQNIKNFEE